MKLLNTCPHCQQTMETETHNLTEPEMSWMTQECNNKIHPKLRILSTLGQDHEVLQLKINKKSDIFTWNYNNKIITVWETGGYVMQRSTLPWFEPDLSDLNRLIEKCKLYIIFS